MNKPALFAILILGLATIGLAASPAPSRAAAAQKCATDGSLTVLCGPEGVEDMIMIPGTNWILGSGLGQNGKAGALHLIDYKAKTWVKLYPASDVRHELDKADYFKCPGAPDPAKFEAHGIALKQLGPKAYRVLAVNHGGRESIEVFNLDVASGAPIVTWIGCVPMPGDIYVNSVAFLPKDGFVLTKFYDPSNPKGFNTIFAGETTGGVYEWHTQQGLTEIPGTGVTGANGIAVSKDGKSLFVNAWGGREVVKFTKSGETWSKAKTVKLDFSPDNLRWSPDGKIFIAGQNGTPDTKTGVPDFKGWTVLKLDPATMATTRVASGPANSPLQNVSNAIDVDGTLWLGAFRGDRIGYMPMH
jgi:hypothetical protein